MFRSRLSALAGAAALAALMLVLRQEGSATITLAAFFGWDDPPLAARRALDDETGVQRATAACMSAHGFEYLAHVEDIQAQLQSALSPAEFASEFGFGIVSQPQAAPVSAVDPNQERIAALPPSQRAAYVDALFATPSHGDYGGGCLGAANLAVYGERDALLAPVREAMEDLNRQVMLDARVRRAESEWVNCMRVAGVKLSSRDGLRKVIQSEIEVPLMSTPKPTRSERALLARREIDLAMASNRCDVPFMETQALVSAEVETRYIAERREYLERIRLEAYPGDGAP